MTRSRGGDDPVPLRDAVARVGKDLGLPEPDVLARVLECWPDVVGDELAPHARVRALQDGVLTVEVDAPTWSTPLRYLESDLCRGLAEALGHPVASAVRVVVARSREGH